MNCAHTNSLRIGRGVASGFVFYFRKFANKSPGPVFFSRLPLWGLYLRGASIRHRALLIHIFSTAFEAPTTICVSKNTSMHLQLYQEKSSVANVM